MIYVFKGIYAPIPTPFDEEGNILDDKLSENVKRWAKTKLAGLVVLGSNGEFVYLSEDEKIHLVKLVRESLPSDRPIIAGTGCESTKNTIELTNRAAAAGADGALVITPHFFGGGMTSKRLKKHYTELAENADIPVMLYNMPRNTGLSMSVDLISQLAEHPNIVGIKDSGGNIAQISQVVRDTPEDFAVFAGSGSFLLPSLYMGAVGGTLAVANVAPNICAEIFEAYNDGNCDCAREKQRKILDLNAAVTTGYGIPGLKAALDMLGFNGGYPRLPLTPVGNEEKAHLRKLLEFVGVL